MNVLRCFVAGLIACAFTFAANAEEKKVDNAKLMIGKWEATKGDEDALPKGTIVEFSKDGKLKITLNLKGKELVIDGTYKITGDKFDISMKGPNGKEDTKTITIVSINDKEMSTTDPDGKKLTLTKTK